VGVQTFQAHYFLQSRRKLMLKCVSALIRRRLCNAQSTWSLHLSLKDHVKTIKTTSSKYARLCVGDDYWLDFELTTTARLCVGPFCAAAKPIIPGSYIQYSLLSTTIARLCVGPDQPSVRVLPEFVSVSILRQQNQ
jgi:hypothetical protein